MLGDPAAVLPVVTAISIALLGSAILICAARFGDHVMAAAGVSQAVVRQRPTRPHPPPLHRQARCLRIS